jgi:hypothetical protein
MRAQNSVPLHQASLFQIFPIIYHFARADGKPVAQILFYPEETIPFNHNPRKNVVHLQCIFNPNPEAQHRGARAPP